MSGPNYIHGHPHLVFACRDCDSAGQLRKREDGTVRCYDCGAEMQPGEVRQRGDRRGENLDTEARRRGAANGPDYDADDMRRIGANGGHPLKVPVEGSD